MNMKRIFLSLVALVTLFSLAAAPVQAMVLSIPTLQTKPQPEAETFMGTILRDSSNFVLSDSATKTRYTLDNPKKASPYEGKTVKITGTLDTAANLIHVETIQSVV
jgi:hypothetical protein